MNRPRADALLADPRNIAILRLLRADPRLAISELARQVGLSAPAARERVQRLEDAGVIAGFRLELDAASLGYPITLFIRIRPEPGKLARVAELARATPQVSECHRITGEDCFILKAHIEGLDRLDALLDSFLPYGQTTTSIAQSSPVPPRGPPLEGD
jgi:Lrp/AsnC family leucine-responsive transcriptional regulator